MVLFSYLLGVFVTTLMLLFIYLKASKRFHWFDQPNESRKIHSQAKPTSAGLIFMLPVVVGIFMFPNLFGGNSFYIGVLVIILLIMGGIDDFKPIPTRLRLIAINVFSALLLYYFFHYKSESYLLLFIYLVGLVWWLNLYNFMDGADGMAALHAIAGVCGYLVVFSLSHFNIESEIVALILLVLVCLLAFLLFNYPSAKMFMGDSGSLAIAFCLAVFALYGISMGLFDELLVISFHLIFIVDATLTLLTRLKFKHKLTHAHNLHYFQALIVQGKSHALVSTLYFCVSILTVAIALIMYKFETNLTIRFSVLMIETIILSYFWFNFHKKTNFERFVKH